MLVAFSVENYRSFQERVTLSMVAADLKSRPETLDRTNVFPAHDDLHLLTSAAVYGANAGGKSNLVAAIRFMRSLVLNSSRETRLREPVNVAPFRLSSDTADQPSFFEIVFIDQGEIYRYG
ncbi:MAG: AAA family ATPase, partial [Chloroflexaceae bacterium]